MSDRQTICGVDFAIINVAMSLQPETLGHSLSAHMLRFQEKGRRASWNGISNLDLEKPSPRNASSPWP
jgi:hypothetical protein